MKHPMDTKNDKEEEEEEEQKQQPQQQQQQQQQNQQSGIDEATQGEVNIQIGDRTLSPYEHTTIRSFEELHLRKELLEACSKAKFIHPSKIQANALPIILKKDEKSGRYPNFVGQAHHGSGKTATFVLSILQRLEEESGKLQALCICHTRELAIQTYEVIKKLSSRMNNVEIFLAVPGQDTPVPWKHQIVVGTPGSILKSVINPTNPNIGSLDKFLVKFKILVLDEADELLRHQESSSKGRGRGLSSTDTGNLTSQTRVIINLIEKNLRPQQKNEIQTLLFSATFPKIVKQLIDKIAPNAVIISVAKKSVKLSNVKNYAIRCSNENNKLKLVKDILNMANIGQMIIFVNTIEKAIELYKNFDNEKVNIPCSVLYGKMPIESRDKTMEDFRQGNTKILIASNLIARGIDVPAVKIVINYEIPIDVRQSSQTQKIGETFDSETFVHRIGRAGRFGNQGVCVSLMHDQESENRLNAIRKEYNLEMKDYQSEDWKNLAKEVDDWVNPFSQKNTSTQKT